MVGEIAMALIMAWMGTTPARGFVLGIGALSLISLVLGARWWAVGFGLVIGVAIRLLREA